MKIKLKAKFHDTKGLEVSIAGTPIQIYQPDTTREILHRLIDEIDCPNCLGRIMATVISAHPDTNMVETDYGYKATLKIQA